MGQASFLRRVVGPIKRINAGERTIKHAKPPRPAASYRAERRNAIRERRAAELAIKRAKSL